MGINEGHKNILHIALPAIVSNITVPLLGLVDVAIVGHLGAPAYIGAIAVGGMLFNIFYMSIFLNKKAMDPVMSGGCISSIMDTTACNNVDIAIFANVERVIHDVFQAGLRHNNRDEDRLATRPVGNGDINSGNIGLGGNLNKRA